MFLTRLAAWLLSEQDILGILFLSHHIKPTFRSTLKSRRSRMEAARRPRTDGGRLLLPN